MLSSPRVSVAGMLSLLLLRSAAAAPSLQLNNIFADRAAAAIQPLMNRDFPDPSIVQDYDGQWYAFATTGNGYRVQSAKAPSPNGPWEWQAVEPLPDAGPWSTGANTWAPDVRKVGPGKYVLYYSGETTRDRSKHCVGAATATSILGPYKPLQAAFACPLEQGGAIDPSGFFDSATNKRYVTYKIDGNSIGNGGECGNTVPPLRPTPIMLQEVAADGVTKLGSPQPILDRIEEDGPYVEAPDIVLRGDTYILFYSSQCYTSEKYRVQYATANKVMGPYTRGNPLVQTGNFGLKAPGGATAAAEVDKMLLHGDCNQGRCMYVLNWHLNGTVVTVS